jgi:hypothetical protein
MDVLAGRLDMTGLKEASLRRKETDMKKVIFWVAGGMTVAIICGLAGLAHLSASITTLTAFCGVPAFIVAALGAWPRLRVSR